MRIFLKVLKWLVFTALAIIVLSVLFLRFSRFSDKLIYQTNGSQYVEFQSELKHEEFYFEVSDDVRLHGVLFKPDSLAPIATVFHFAGKGMHLMSSVQKFYEPLLEAGFQVFCYERRDFGKSNGEATNSLTLQRDALFVFDQVMEMNTIANKPVIVWGQSLGGAFATMTANNRQDQVKGLVLEGTFSSFPDIGKVYAKVLNLENFKWVVPLIMNDDFPAHKEIETLTIPTVILHSTTDKEVPYDLGKKLFKSANKQHTKFWDIEGKHIRGILKYEQAYVDEFLKIVQE